ncbi:hypothetical protein TM102_39540 [Bradyrhizobium sp. TM102]|nr:hypothetical protein TM102_39540 [Bradyrhizobium sp. TM102]
MGEIGRHGRLAVHGDGVGFLGPRAASAQPTREHRGKDAKAETGALEKALELEHRHTLIRGPASLESYHREFHRAQPRMWPKTVVGIDLFVGHVKKAGNRARAPSPSLICLN